MAKKAETKKKLQKQVQKPVGSMKELVTKADTPHVIGKPYSAEQLQALIAKAVSNNNKQQIAAVAEYTQNQERVSEGAAKEPDFSDTQLLEFILAAIRKNEEHILRRFEDEKNKTGLTFLANSSSVPPKTREKAEAVLNRLDIKIPTKKSPEPAITQNFYTPQMIQILIAKLESPKQETRVQALIEFIREYPRITPTVLKVPMLTVTSVTEKAVKILQDNPKYILKLMVDKKMLPELTFISSLRQVPMPIRKEAEKAVRVIQPPQPKSEQPKSRVVAVAERHAAKEPTVEKVKTPKAYTPFELEALLSGLGSVERVRAVKAAIEFLKNYDIIIEAISKAPLLTVTEVTVKAVKVIESNLNSVIAELKKKREINALSLLAHSQKFSEQTRKKAKVALKLLMSPFEEEDQ